VSFLSLTPGTGSSGVAQHVADKRDVNIFRPLFEIPSKLASFAPKSILQKNTETSSDSGLYIDIRRFGAYFSPDPPRTTARCVEGSSTNAIALLSDGAASVQVAITGPSNDSGPISQDYPAGASLAFGVQTPAMGCTIAPADANAIIQYRCRSQVF
jgi:hypothetical protein